LLAPLGAACGLLALAGAAQAHSLAVAAPASHTGQAGSREPSHLIEVVAKPSQSAKAPPKVRLYLIGWVDDAPPPHSRAAEILVERASASRDGRSR
jgi:hypothetical protein